jgi:DNA-binding MarR family transcriptional regulator
MPRNVRVSTLREANWGFRRIETPTRPIYLLIGKQSVWEEVSGVSEAAVLAGLGDDTAPRLRAAINRISRRLRPTKAGSGFTATEISVLETVALHGPTRVSDVAATEALNPTMLSRVVQKLERQGLVRRQPDPDDGRAALIETSGPGRRLFERIRSERTDQLSLILDGLSHEERARVLAALPVLEELAERLKARPAR